MTTGDLRSLSRRELVERAEKLGVARAAALTKTELVEAIREASEPSGSRRSRTWFGKARDLVARVVEQGLHLPSTAKILRGQAPAPSKAPPPLPTVTLAEIYAAQGYTDKALAVLEAVLERVPDHPDAIALRERLSGSAPTDGPTTQPSAEEPEPSRAEPTASDADADTATEIPPRYDDVVALATDPRTAYVYWEVRAVSFARARWRATEGRLVLRVLSMVPGEGGAEQRTRDVPVDELAGDTFVTGLVPGSEVRFAIGWLGDDFAALAVAPELTMPRDYTAPVKSTRRATMSQAAAMRAAARQAPSAAPERGPLYELAGRRLADYRSGSPTSVVHFQRSTGRVRTVLRAGGASDLLVDHEHRVAHHAGIPLEWLAGGASDLVAGGASDLVGRR